jgi:hypothetical protein
MHACLSHIYNHVYLIYLFVVYPQESVMVMCEQRYLNKDRSSVMLTLSIQLYSVLCFTAPE